MTEKEKIQQYIQSLVKNVAYYELQKPTKGTVKPTVTLSRDYGSGGTQIAKALAGKLGVTLYDDKFLEAIAKEAQVDVDLMAELDEKVCKHKTDWVVSLITGQNASSANYRHHLVSVALGILCSGGVIIGRGVHVILAEHDVFRVRLVGSTSKCAERIANYKKISVDEAKDMVLATNHQRGDFLWETFHQRLNDPTLFDLVINTDNFTNQDSIVELILKAMGELGFMI
jgi:cytidylate kinase